MKARAAASVEPRGRVVGLDSAPPLTLRQVTADPGDGATLCLVGAAAGPLAGDELELSLDIRPGAAARLISTGASLAQGREHPGVTGTPARLRTSVVIGAGGSLVATPPPFVACAGSRTAIEVTIDLAATASLDWRELVVLGRSNEGSGAVRVDWDVHRDGVPLLRQSIDLTDRRLSSWPGMLAGHRVMATQLLVAGVAEGASYRPATVVLSPTAVAQQLDDQSVLLTVLAADTATAESTLAELRARILTRRPVSG